MKKMLAGGIAGLLLALGAGVAHAGTSRHAEVQLRSTEAWGVPRHARESADALQYIGCGTIQVGHQPARTTCFARDASGRSLACRNATSETGTAAQAEAISGIGADSHILFQVSGSQCVTLSVYNDSRYLDGPTSVLPVGGVSR